MAVPYHDDVVSLDQNKFWVQYGGRKVLIRDMTGRYRVNLRCWILSHATAIFQDQRPDVARVLSSSTHLPFNATVVIAREWVRNTALYKELGKPSPLTMDDRMKRIEGLEVEIGRLQKMINQLKPISSEPGWDEEYSKATHPLGWDEEYPSEARGSC